MLSLADLGILLTELRKVRDKWYNLGLQLPVPLKELLKIEAEYKTDTSTCLCLLLSKWLKLGSASWESLIEALQSPSVLGRDADLVITLQNKYCPVKRQVTERMNPRKEPPVKVL